MVFQTDGTRLGALLSLVTLGWATGCAPPSTSADSTAQRAEDSAIEDTQPREDTSNEPTSCDDLPGTAHFEPAEGGDEDWTQLLAGEVVIDRAGTLMICEGLWSVNLHIAASDVTVTGVGQEATVLEVGDDSTIRVGPDLTEVEVRDLSLTLAPDTTDWSRGGIIVDNGTAAHLQHLTIKELNMPALFVSAGALVTGSDLLITDNDLSEWGAEGVVQVWQAAHLSLERAVFRRNQGTALMGYYEETSIELTNCEFTENSGERAGAVSLHRGASLTTTNCVFRDNVPVDIAP